MAQSRRSQQDKSLHFGNHGTISHNQTGTLFKNNNENSRQGFSGATVTTLGYSGRVFIFSYFLFSHEHSRNLFVIVSSTQIKTVHSGAATTHLPFSVRSFMLGVVEVLQHYSSHPRRFIY